MASPSIGNDLISSVSGELAKYAVVDLIATTSKDLHVALEFTIKADPRFLEYKSNAAQYAAMAEKSLERAASYSATDSARSNFFSRLADTFRSAVTQANTLAGKLIDDISKTTNIKLYALKGLNSVLPPAVNAAPSFLLGWKGINDSFDEGISKGKTPEQIADEVWYTISSTATSVAASFSSAARSYLAAAPSIQNFVLRAGVVGLGISFSFYGGWKIGKEINKVIERIFEAPSIKLGVIKESLELLKRTLTGRPFSRHIDDFYKLLQRYVDPAPSADPLTLDLDGDGIETVGIDINSPILFDHDGDGIKTATGWLASDDGFLVLDRSGNGAIDNGTELFGDSMLVSDGQGGTRKAVDGFDALASVDSNRDGVIDSSDAEFSNLRVWRDLNQDGISQADELSTLAELGVASINVTKTENNTNLPNGNAIADLGTFMRVDGSVSATGTLGQVGDVNFAQDTFQSQFVDTISITTEASVLPSMAGAGQVRSLQEAASLSPSLYSLLSQYSQAATRGEQLSQIDALIKAWSDTSPMPTTATGAYTGHPLSVSFGVPVGSAQHQVWLDRLTVLERFNGQTYRVVPAGAQAVNIGFNGPRMRLLELSHQALRQSVYLSLYAQTRGSEYLGAVGLALNPDGSLALDFSELERLVADKLGLNQEAVLLDLVDLIRVAGPQLASIGWNGIEYLARVIESSGIPQPLRDSLVAEGIYVFDPNQANYYGGDSTVDLISGNESNNIIGGGRGVYGYPIDSQIYGAGGDDSIAGGEGNDFLDGGVGNDGLHGFSGSDTYLFRPGSGQDTVHEYYLNIGQAATDIDTISIVGLTPEEVSVRRVGNNLALWVPGTNDALTVIDQYSPNEAGSRIERISFQDGTTWGLGDIARQILTATEFDDVLTGTGQNDVIRGLGGNDLVIGLGGNDTLDGGQGDDVLVSTHLSLDYRHLAEVIGYGGLYTLYANYGYVDDIPNGNDVYVFGKGYGHDKVIDRDSSLGNLDVVQMTDDVNPGEVRLTRNGDDLVLSITATGDTLTVNRWFDQNESPHWRVEEIHFSDGTVWGYRHIQQAVLDSAGTSGHDTIVGFSMDDVIIGYSGNDVIRAGAGQDYLSGGDGNDVLDAGSGDDLVAAGAGNDFLLGGDGQDSLDGGDGDDRLIGGNGDDLFRGGAGNDVQDGGNPQGFGSGNDTYLFGRGDGHDAIDDYDPTPGNLDAIVFDADIAPGDVQLSRFEDGIRLTIADTGDTLDVRNYLYNDYPYGQIEQIRFADGTIWDVPTVKALLLQGTPGHDTIIGYSSNDTVDGLAGNDTIYGAGGEDILVGGTGSDSLYGDEGDDRFFGGDGSDLLAGGNGADILDGGAGNDRLVGGHTWSNIYNPVSNGNDTYVFGRGQGTDTIVDTDGVAGNHDIISFNSDTLPEDVIVRRSGNDLHLRIAGTDDNLTVSNFFAGTENQIEEVRFADGTVWDVPTLYVRGLIPTPSDDAITGYETNDIITGLDGADVLRGREGNDRLDGGLGDDDLDGGAGSDVYAYGTGQGNDVIRDSGATSAGTDTVLLNGLTPDDVTLSLAGPDLIVQLNATGEQLALVGWQNGTNGIEQLVFGDGTVWDEATIRGYPFAGTADDDYLEGSNNADILDGGAGNDIIYGLSGNDRLYGGAGDDQIYGDGYYYATGGTDSDFIDGGAGNDQISAGQGNDTYLVSNDGFDVIGDGGGANTMVFAPGITLADLSIQAYRAIESGGGDYELTQVAVGIGEGAGAYYRSEVGGEAGPYTETSLRFVFADGTTLTQDEIFARVDGGVIGYQQGTVGDDRLLGSVVDDDIVGYDGNDQIDGRGGNDGLQGWDGNDVLAGGFGDDSIGGDEGADILAGGRGNDHVSGGNGNDVYTYNRGDGRDLIENRADPALPGIEMLSFGLGIQPGDVRGYVDAEGRLVLTFGGGDSVSLYWFDIYDGNAIFPDAVVERVQFVSSEGIRVFDLAGTVASLATELLAADVANPIALFTPATAGYELTGTVAPANDAHVVAYGLTGDPFGVPAQYMGDSNDNDIIRGRSGDDTITDLGGNNTILAGDGNNVVTTGGGDDVIATGSGNDVIVAGDGMDRIDAGAGNDAITGGLSNDTLIGGAGNDTYYFNLGDGVDSIDDLATPGEGNRVVFGVGIAQDDLKLSHDGSILTIAIGTGGDGLRLSNFDPSSPLGTHAIDSFEFSDGSVLTYGELIGRGFDLSGTGTDDLLLGTGASDRIVAQGGNDVIVGGIGNDLLDGGSGNDLYVFNLGDGVDTIVDRASSGVGNTVVFGAGITSANLVLRLDTAGASPALVIQVGIGGDAIRLDGFNPADASGSRVVETFRFADGTSLSYDQLLGLGIAVDGTAASESLTGSSVRDRLRGAGGNDQLTGGEGDDTYLFNAGEGVVTIDDIASPIDPNTLVFGSGISPADLKLGLDAVAGELVIRVGQTGDAVRLSGFNPDDPYGNHAVEFYRFADGTVLTYAQLLDRGFDVLGTDANDDLRGTSTTDRITGSAGHDLIRGGAGDDFAAGGAGDDTYVYRIGDGILTIDDLATIGEGNTLEFGEGIALADMRNRLSFLPPAPGQAAGTFIIRIGEGTGDEVHLTNFNPDDADLGEHAVELFRFADGTTVNYRQLVQNTFIVQGDTGDDALRGTNLTDRLYGYEGSDTLRGQLGNDTLTGGTGNDELYGEEGDDTYVFNLGDGIDTIHETATPAAPNRIVFGAGIARTDLRFEQVGNLLTIHYGDQGDAIRLPDFNFSDVDGTVVAATLEFEDGSTADLATLMNQSPVLDAPLADVAVRVEDVLSYAVPAGTFSDPDVGDTLSYSASLADGSVLPSWLQFDASSGSFTGTPALGDLAVLAVRVTATDAHGLSANDSFTLSVVPRNRAPEVAQPLADLAVDEDATVSLAIPADAFTDPDAGDTLAYSATLADGTALPAWLTFDAATRTFTGTPANGDVGVLDIRVTATDREGVSVSDAFTLSVNNVNDAPVLTNALADRSTTEGQAFSFTLDPATFSDDDAIHGDTLSVRATLADGSTLPGWLTFVSSSQTFSGTAPDGSTVTGTDGDDMMVSSDVDTVHALRVTATDTGGLSVSDDFALTVHDASPDDVYDGRGGNDVLDTGLGNDTLTGGTGNDVLLGGVGDDTYLYNLGEVATGPSLARDPRLGPIGDGLDTLTDTDGVDTLRFGPGITAEQVVVRLDSAAGLARLRFLDADGCETTDYGINITLNADGSLPIESVVFADGSTLTPQALMIQSLTWTGTNRADVLTTGRHDDTIYGGNGKDVLTSGSGNDTLYGENGDDRLYGQGGNDTLTGGRGDDRLDGGCGDDTLIADQGEDTLIGGQGNDTILLGSGEHTILFGVGDGQDTVRRLATGDDDDAEAEVVFGQGIDPNKLWFARSGNDLTVQLLGTQDGMTLEGWYDSKHKPIEEFQTADGSELEGQQIERLVQAMAQFAPSLSADGTLPADQQQELNAVIAATWERGG